MRLIQPKPRSLRFSHHSNQKGLGNPRAWETPGFSRHHDVTDDVTIGAESRPSVTSWRRCHGDVTCDGFETSSSRSRSCQPTLDSLLLLYFSTSTLLIWARRREINWGIGAAYSVMMLPCQFYHLAYLMVERWHKVEQHQETMDSAVSTTDVSWEGSKKRTFSVSAYQSIEYLIDWQTEFTCFQLVTGMHEQATTSPRRSDVMVTSWQHHK